MTSVEHRGLLPGHGGHISAWGATPVVREEHFIHTYIHTHIHTDVPQRQTIPGTIGITSIRRRNHPRKTHRHMPNETLTVQIRYLPCFSPRCSDSRTTYQGLIDGLAHVWYGISKLPTSILNWHTAHLLRRIAKSQHTRRPAVSGSVASCPPEAVGIPFLSCCWLYR